jgi:DNA end-binding protein Ku
MLQIAEEIVEQQSGNFDPSEFRDRYEDALRALIEDKIKGRPVKPQKPANDDKVVDLVAALKKSLEDGAGGGRRQRAERLAAAQGKPRKGGARTRVA